MSIKHLSNKAFKVVFVFTLPVFVIVCSTTGMTHLNVTCRRFERAWRSIQRPKSSIT